MIAKLIKCRYHTECSHKLFPLFSINLHHVENLQVRVAELQEKLNGRNHFENLAVNGKIIIMGVGEI
jgi:hypothetical protein